jgi:hypothetical protein
MHHRSVSNSSLNVLATAVLAALVLSSGAAQAARRSLCKPILAIKQAQLSEPRGVARVWTAVVDVDASLCASSSGRFDIEFVRLKENAPDLPFTEHFAWEGRQVRLSLDLWADEAVHDYAIGYVQPCACRR